MYRLFISFALNLVSNQYGLTNANLIYPLILLVEPFCILVLPRFYFPVVLLLKDILLQKLAFQVLVVVVALQVSYLFFFFLLLLFKFLYFVGVEPLFEPELF
jgi:hypothetical protein